MKKYILLVGVLGIFSLYAGCSDSGSALAPADDDGTSAESSSSAKVNSSADNKDKSSSSDKPASSDGKQGTTDTTTVHQPVYVTDTGTVAASSYVSSGIFCWTEGCEAQFASSSSAASSSSEKIVIEISSPSVEPPEINGDRMTDKRDEKTYKLQNIAGKLWMAEDLKYETSGSYCSTEGGEDHCAKYGRFYTYSAAQRACPSGWRLPTASEVTAADAEVAQTWWSIGGRFKLSGGTVTEYGLENEQGYIWIQADGENNSFRVKNYNGDDVHELQHSDGEERAYNVRCVQE